MSKLRLLGSSLVGAADQALLSALNLAIALAFIRTASKAEYAEYALATTLLLLLQSGQNALVNSPLATLAPAAQPDKRLSVDAAGWRLQRLLSGAVLVAGSVLVGLAWVMTHLSWAALLAGSTVAALGLMNREYRRAQCFLRHDPWAALRADAAFTVLALAGLGALLTAKELSAAAALAVIGFAGILAGLGGARRPAAQPQQAMDEASREIWGCARWALPSVVNSWLYANGYLFLVERLMSKDAVADLSVSRLLLMPLSLLVVGWASAFRPRASQWLANGRIEQLHTAAMRSACGFVAAGLTYGAALFLTMPLLQSHVLGDKYVNAALLAAPWLLFVVIGMVRSVGMTSMLASPAAFRPLFAYGVLALGVAVLGTLVAGLLGTVWGVPLALSAAEALLLLLIWCLGWPRIRAVAEVQR